MWRVKRGEWSFLKSVRLGAVLSYLNAGLNLVTHLLLTPMLLTGLGEENYSLYKVIQSLAGPLILLRLGLSTVTARAGARYWADPSEKNRREKENAFTLSVLLSGTMALTVALLGFAMTGLVPALLGEIGSSEKLSESKALLAVLAAATAVHILSDTLTGSARGREHFVFLQSCITAHHLLRFGLFLLIARRGGPILWLGLADLGLYTGLLTVNALYCFLTGERLRLHNPTRRELVAIGSFAAALFLQGVVSQINANLDTVILGAAGEGPEVITLYSSALTIYTAYCSLVGTLSGIFLPKAARLTAEGAGGQALTDFVIGPGGIQAMLALWVLGAFALFGGDFIRLWIGERYLAAHPLALFLMACGSLPLIQSLCQSLLDARLKRLFQSAVLGSMAALNLLLSLLWVKPLGFWGPALATGLTLVLGQGILMNVYYARTLGLDIPRMLRSLLRGTGGAAAAACLLCLPLVRMSGGWGKFIGKCGLYTAIYGFFLWRGKMLWKPKKPDSLC